MKAYEKNLSHTPNEIVFHKSLTDDEKLLTAVLYGFKPKNDGDTFPGQEILAEICGCTEKTIGRKLETLIKKNVISRTRIKNRKYHYTFTFDNKENFTIIPMSFLADASTTDEEKMTYIKLQQLKFTYAQGGNQYFINKLGIDIGRFYALYGQLVKKGYLEDSLIIIEKEKLATQVVIEKPVEVDLVIGELINNIQETEEIITPELKISVPSTTPTTAKDLINYFYTKIGGKCATWSYDTKTINNLMSNHSVSELKNGIDLLVKKGQTKLSNLPYVLNEALQIDKIKSDFEKEGTAAWLIKKHHTELKIKPNPSTIIANAAKVQAVINEHGFKGAEKVINHMIDNKTKELNFINGAVDTVLAGYDAEYEEESAERLNQLDMQCILTDLKSKYEQYKSVGLTDTQACKDIMKEYNERMNEYKKVYGGK